MGVVIMQHNGTRGQWRHSTSGLAHIHTATDDPNLHRKHREGQHWDQVCPQALAATSGQVRVRKGSRWLHSIGQNVLVFLWAWVKEERRKNQLLLGILSVTSGPCERGAHVDPGPTKEEQNMDPLPPNQGSGKPSA